MTGANGYVIRDIEAKDAEAWTRLYNGYREFYNLPADASAVATTWEWMLARQHGLRGIVAEKSDGEIAGEDGANIVRWITASDNTKARSVYDSRAVATPGITYDMKPSSA